ncbi:glycerophosphodiester phosphodiesterase [Paenibacillus hodogayensis]|uniref:Glycerophosphodiester phosphodiesterase n=1 Tax=Paenibacillus hodogayensis TaxID=279208 RepID=A0ABV5W6M4_9BACL
MFMNLAHRGASQYAPENTLAAFYYGIQLGANGLETDLRISRDGVVFLLHDDRLERTTNGSGRHTDYTWAELQELDAGSWFAPAYAGERLISFETFAHLFGRKPLKLALELKDDGIEEEVAHVVRKYELQSNAVVTSFDFDSLRQLRRLDEHIPLGYLANQWDADLLERLKETRVGQLCPNAETLTKEQVNLLKREGFEVRAWKVKDEALMRHCLQCGVDGMTINFPEKLHEALNGEEASNRQ